MTPNKPMMKETELIVDYLVSDKAPCLCGLEEAKIIAEHIQALLQSQPISEDELLEILESVMSCHATDGNRVAPDGVRPWQKCNCLYCQEMQKRVPKAIAKLSRLALPKVDREKEFIEKGANLEHDRWARWQEYIMTKSFKIISELNGVTTLTIPTEYWEHWKRQIATPYSELSEKEKEYDREETRNYLALVKQLVLPKVEREKLIEIQEELDKIDDPDMSPEEYKAKLADAIITYLEDNNG